MGPIPSVSIQKSIRYSQNWLRNKNIILSQISTQFTLWFIPRTVLLKMSPYYTSVPFWYSSSHSATRSRNHTSCHLLALSQTTHSHVIYWACAVPVAEEFPVKTNSIQGCMYLILKNRPWYRWYRYFWYHIAQHYSRSTFITLAPSRVSCLFTKMVLPERDSLKHVLPMCLSLCKP